MNRIKAMLEGMRARFCSESARRADQALAVSAENRRQRNSAVETSRISNNLMNEALRKLHDALQRTAH